MTQDGLSAAELQAEGVTALPDKEVVSILDPDANLDLAVDAAAPIDLAVAARPRLPRRTREPPSAPVCVRVRSCATLIP